jgi:alkylhydroperoxidase/carboxymuconolactone decarboxylase family protein YurZ
MPKIPKRYTDFTSQNPEIARAHAALGNAVHAAGPLDERERALVKLGIAIGARGEGAVHAQTRKALEAGLSPDELRHVALLALPTLGFPSAMAALSWVEDVSPAARKGRKGRR